MQRLITFAMVLAVTVAAIADPSDRHHVEAVASQHHPVFVRLSSEIAAVRDLLDDQPLQAEIGIKAMVATIDSDLTYARAYNHLRAQIADLLLARDEINRANTQLFKGMTAATETLTYIDAILNAEIDPPAGYSRQAIRAIREQEMAKVKELLGGYMRYHMAAAESRDRVETIPLADDEFDPVFTRFVQSREQAIRNYALTSHAQPYEFPDGDLIAAAKADLRVRNMLILAYHVLKANEFISDQRSLTPGPVVISRIPEPGEHSFYEFSTLEAARAQR